MRVARTTVVVAAGALGALFAVGCVVAALFELQGFGAPRDGDPRLGYLLALSAAFVASIAAPLTLWRILLPETSPRTAVIAAVALTALVAWLLGVSVLT